MRKVRLVLLVTTVAVSSYVLCRARQEVIEQDRQYEAWLRRKIAEEKR